MAGDITDKVRNRWITDNQGLVYHLAGRVFRNLPVRHDFDDLVGYGMLGLTEAAEAYIPAKGTKFSTFAFYRIRGAIYDGISETSWMTRSQYRRHIAAVNAQATDNDDETSIPDFEIGGVVELSPDYAEQIADQTESVSQVMSQLETEAILIECINDLPRREHRMITMVYFDGIPLQDAAERIGVSKSWASRLHAQIIQKLGRQISQKGNEPKDTEPEL